MQESAFTKKELQAVKKPLLQIIKTNRITNMVKLGKMLESLGYDERFGYHYNMVHVLKFHDIHKKDGHYQYIDPKNADKVAEAWADVEADVFRVVYPARNRSV